MKSVGFLLCVVAVISATAVGFGAGWPALVGVVGFGFFIAGRLRD